MPYKNKELQREYNRLWLRKRKAEFFTGKVCKKCGSVSNLVLHHRVPSEKVSHKIWSWAKVRRDFEIAKCDILCESCHILHHTKLRQKLIHGTTTMYGNHGCRCSKCTEAATIAKRVWRASRSFC